MPSQTTNDHLGLTLSRDHVCGRCTCNPTSIDLSYEGYAQGNVLVLMNALAPVRSLTLPPSFPVIFRTALEDGCRQRWLKALDEAAVSRSSTLMDEAEAMMEAHFEAVANDDMYVLPSCVSVYVLYRAIIIPMW